MANAFMANSPSAGGPFSHIRGVGRCGARGPTARCLKRARKVIQSAAARTDAQLEWFFVVDPADTNGKCVAMIAWRERDDGSYDAAVFSGVANWDGVRLAMILGSPKPPFAIPDEWLDRLFPVPDDL